MLARANKRSTNNKKFNPTAKKGGYLLCDKIEVGYFVSTDQFFCKTPVLLTTGYGRESSDHRFQGGTIYNYAASSLVLVENQVSLRINETVMGKSRFEQLIWYQAVAEVSHYNGNNVIFTTVEYRHDCNEKWQTQFFLEWVPGTRTREPNVS